jgi:hypothetical protein
MSIERKIIIIDSTRWPGPLFSWDGTGWNNDPLQAVVLDDYDQIAPFIADHNLKGVGRGAVFSLFDGRRVEINLIPEY